MDYSVIAACIAFGLFLGMLLLLEVGRRIGKRRHARDAEGARAGIGAIEGSMFGLLGLLIAFTFSGAASRFDHRRMQIVEEANAIGTAYLRIDLMPAEQRDSMRARFREYLDSRLKAFELVPDLKAVDAELARTAQIQDAIWKSAMEGVAASGPGPLAMLFVPAVNQMFDMGTARTATARLHPPMVIFALLASLTLIGALLAGFGMAGGKARSPLHMVAFALVMATTVYVIADIEYPRIGLLKVDDFDIVLNDLRRSMN
ncbi:MAG: DUF4239 domain-containing protein [Phycisphaerae bacterium]|nr:DUF4239 domain-containing protein [Phycisphaerae bacterium]